MKVGISRFVIVAAVAVLVLAGSVAVLAQSPSFSDFSSTANLTLNGNAAAPVNNGTANVLRLTPATTSQAGSAWFNIQQPVAGGFTTVFQFQFTGASDPPADGIAFVIQNSSLSALGQGGGSIGYADGGLPCGETPPPCGGIPNSLAVEFDTFNNTTATGDPNANHIAVQSCGVSDGVPQRNSPAHVSPNDYGFPNCLIGSIASPDTTMSGGGVHTVVIDYTPPPPGECFENCGTLTVKLDGTNVLTTFVTLEDEMNLEEGGKAWVGLTGATGAAFENHDILSWTFTPHTSTTIEENIPPGQQGVFTFGSFNYKVTNSNNTALDLIVTANSLSPDTVFPSPGGQCIVYAGTGGNCWGFDVHCPVTGCTASTANLDLATSYDSDQPAAFFTSPGFLKIEPDCASIDTGTATDQITDFLFLRHDPTTKGTSGGGISCWVATINTPTPYAASIQQPINSDGSSIFSGKKGVVPVKFTLIMNGAPTCSLPPATIAVTRTAGGVPGVIDESVYTMSADSGSNFRVSGCQYVYNLSAAAMGPGTYRVDISIAGSVVPVSATFALK
jgi:hypothetical protein